MFTFQQSKGLLWSQDGSIRTIGWAGQRDGKNNPNMQDVPKTGPLPQGSYTIGAPHDSPHTGKYTMDLTPASDNNMFGRSDFRIHGAAFENPELSSEGCIIMPRPVREKIWASGDRTLQVIP